MGDPKDAFHSLLKKMFRGAATATTNALAVVKDPTEEGLWSLLTAAMAAFSTRLDHTVSEAMIVALVAGFIRICYPNVHIGADETTLSNRNQCNLRLDSYHGSRGGESLVIEFKRLRPASINSCGDIPLTQIQASSAAEARRLLENQQLDTSKQTFHGLITTVEALERSAMEECKAYRDALKQDTKCRIRCATAIHVTVANGVGPDAEFTGGFLVSVEENPKQKSQKKKGSKPRSSILEV
jgi:hypothetical protein